MPITKKKNVRKNIRVDTLEKVRKFLEKQKEPIAPSNAMRELSVDYHSLKIAMKILKVKTDKEGRVFLRSKK